MISGAIRVHDDMFLAAGTLFSSCSHHLNRQALGLYFDPWTQCLVLLTWNANSGAFAAEALARQINKDHLAKKQLYPAFSEIREISAHIGAAVAAKAYELGKLLNLWLLGLNISHH